MRPLTLNYRSLALLFLTQLGLTLLSPSGFGADDPRCTGDYTPTLPGYDFKAGIDRWGQKSVEHGLSAPIRVDQIHVNPQPIFNVLDEREDKWLFRLANRLHTNTRHDVLRKFVLFEPDSLVDDQILAESERLLREQRFVSEAAIRVVRQCTDFVDLEIVTREVWTLVPDIKVKTGGGNSTFGLGFKDTNFLGSGNGVGVSYVSEPERDRAKFHYRRQNLFGSRTALGLDFEQNSDGHVRTLRLADDFYSLGTPRGWSFGVTDSRKEHTTQQYGNVMDRFEFEHRSAETWFGSATIGDKLTQRWLYGVALDEARYTEPDGRVSQDRRLFYPFSEWQWIEDDFGVAYNINQIHKAEDIHLGMDLRTRFGLSLSGENRFIYEGAYVDTWSSRNKQLLQAALTWAGRWNFDSGQAENINTALSVTYHHGQTRNRNLYLNLKVSNTWHRDRESALVLGGVTGLRGYPANFLAGERSYLFTAEQRLFTELHPFRLFRVGFAAFFDAGKMTSEINSNTSFRVNSGYGSTGEWLYDVGLGLRLIPDKTSKQEVIHIDVGFPLKNIPGSTGPQFLIELRETL
ncbi:MAG: BamA/TamA family outer membrane protein [Proteobacteria bacterium]|nr:BamA/TamA family outer membrane protein [Pseudomonadota bacterium]MDA1301259.1 BamA/TamA family outer membrane protein [Pseudomonadota bacterium]